MSSYLTLIYKSEICADFCLQLKRSVVLEALIIIPDDVWKLCGRDDDDDDNVAI